jgi:hypothetical protein
MFYCSQTFRRLKNGVEEKVQSAEKSLACFENEKGIDSFTFRFQGKGKLSCFIQFIPYSFKL